MTTQNLSSISLKTIENYAHAGSLAVDAYRAGSHRMIVAVNSRLDKNVYSRTATVVPHLTNALVQVRDSLSEVVARGVDSIGSGANMAIDLSSSTAIKGVKQASKFAEGVESRVAAKGLASVARLTLPSAQAAHALSVKLLEGAGKLPGTKKRASRVVKATSTVKKAAARSKAAVVREVAAAPVAVKAAAKTARATVTRAKRKVAEVVAVA